jgi:ABC-type arginine/histidine transport system permease subunit
MAVSNPPGLLLLISHVLCAVLAVIFTVAVLSSRDCLRHSETTFTVVPGENPLAGKPAR